MGSAGATREAPQAPQNRWSGGFTCAQAGQPRARDPPQPPQKRLVAGFSLPHDGQVTPPGLRLASVGNHRKRPAHGNGTLARASWSVDLRQRMTTWGSSYSAEVERVNETDLACALRELTKRLV